jgi:hypothetical protein
MTLEGHRSDEMADSVPKNVRDRTQHESSIAVVMHGRKPGG